MSRLNPKDKWIITEIPEMRIVDDTLWERVKRRQSEIDAKLAAPAPSPVRLHPQLSEIYRRKVEALAETLSDPEFVHRASEILGELIDRITIRHDAELGHTAQIEGKLMGLSGFADAKNAAALSGAACSQKSLVAGGRIDLDRTTGSL